MKTDALRTVLVAALDRSIAADQVVHTAVSMARIIPGAELHFVHAVDLGSPPHVLAVPMMDLIRDGRALLDEVVGRVQGQAPRTITGHLTVGEPASRILQLASDLGADLIIVGAQSKNAVERMLLGSVSRAVAAKAPCAVLVARAKRDEPVPEVEPPCPACVDMQRTSGGEKLWCARHSERHVHGHLHCQLPEAYGLGSMFIRPED
jgi:nucleotide-binding universal stress UspA family protein